MGLLKTSGIVIKALDYKEHDKLIWIYTEQYGKISAVAKGSKRNKSDLFSVTLPLSFGDYLLFKGKGMCRLSEGKLRNSFQGLLTNLEKLTYSTYLCELIDISTEDEEKNFELYKEFVTAIYLLDTDALDYELLTRAFELKLLKATGYGLNFDTCVSCEKKIQSSTYINLSNFGGVCDMCDKVNGLYISRPSFSALRFLNKATLDKVYRVNLNEDMKKELFKITQAIISNNYTRRPKSLDMLKFI
ncbi:DNA repair protein RecO [uncultured Clostridium sp.]|uniref:DNA repair protein RecO n=1 Tax=uncultured Clostridium sp. TaxID=59620 RepID=UPI0026381C89|nr:DNA repair protein RecO [uncultured Clostridium sp.]